jgi:hypothetical protein
MSAGVSRTVRLSHRMLLDPGLAEAHSNPTSGPLFARLPGD